MKRLARLARAVAVPPLNSRLSTLNLQPGVWLDARRAVWLEKSRALLIADPHLGYAWAHRERGNLLPISVAEDTTDRLLALAREYSAREIIVLGDVIHAAVRAEVVAADLRRLHALDGVSVRLLAGNHDRDLAEVLRNACVSAAPVRDLERDGHLLLHGDGDDETAVEARCAGIRAQGGRVILGHEHPALSLSDGVTTSARCPCFLVGDDVLVLPAFSPWASGTDVRGGRFLSPYVRRARLTQAVAVVAGKLLPVSL